MPNQHPAHIRAILDDPATSQWLRQALLAAATLDPVDMVNDVEVLRTALQESLDHALAAARREELDREMTIDLNLQLNRQLAHQS